MPKGTSLTKWKILQQREELRSVGNRRGARRRRLKKCFEGGGLPATDPRGSLKVWDWEMKWVRVSKKARVMAWVMA